MRTLGIESTGEGGGVAIVDSGIVLARESFDSPRGHVRWLVPLARKALESLSWDVRRIELVGVDRGPGSYAGIRVGITVAKSLALALEIPVVALDALDLVALENPGLLGKFGPVLDARRGHVASARFERAAPGAKPVRTSKDVSIEPATLLAELDAPATFFGPGVEAYKALFESAGFARIDTGATVRVRPETVALEAERFYRDRPFDPGSGHALFARAETDDLVGLYLRPTAAESTNRGESRR